MDYSHDNFDEGHDSARTTSARYVPSYLYRVYRWAYLSPRWAKFLDHQWVVQTILWGKADRLMNSAMAEFHAGETVLLPACVYGQFARRLAAKLGPHGRLHIRDVAPLQLDLTRRKLAGVENVDIGWADAAIPSHRDYDGICCFFLLHEVPSDYKRRIVQSLLGAVKPDGKAVFVDYHGMSRWHPLRPVMRFVFKMLEPFAKELTETEIADLASSVDGFEIRKQLFFGGLYQKVIFLRKD